MAKFKGKNKINSVIKLAFERNSYEFKAFPMNSGLGDIQIKDLSFAERVMYGRTDTNLDVVLPMQQFIKPVNAGNDSVSLMNFAADAFNDFKATFQRCLNGGNIRPDDPTLSVIQAFRGYQNPKTNYENYMEDVIQSYHNVFIKDTRTKIITPKDYVEEFKNYIKRMSPEFPVSFTGWHRSKHSSVFSSGLAIDIGGLPMDDDELKERMINSPNFEFYKNAALNHGFSIVKNSPWIMVCDLGSPALTIYHEKYNLSSKKDIFSLQFDKSYIYDIEYIKLILYNNYTILYNRYNYEKRIEVCNKKVNVTNIFRKDLSFEKFNSIFDDSYWIDFYTIMRHYEEGERFSETDRQLFSRNGRKLKKTFDIQRAIGYINEQHRSVYKSKPGGVNDIIKKRIAKKSK